MKVAIGCDDAAWELKELIKDYLVKTRAIEFEDVGISSPDEKELYPNVAKKVANLIQDKKNGIEFGILICGTGIGMALAANKFKGIRAAVCHDAFSTSRAKLSNNTNVMTMGARVIGPETAKMMVDIWLDNKYAGGRSESKVNRIDVFEKENFA
jgi:ribose 5-phosphate isomerase B